MELLKLGLRVAKRTIQRHIRSVRPPGRCPRWRTFLKNHSVWACDLLQIYDIGFRSLFAFFVMDVNTKQVIHVAVTREPNQCWNAQQLRQLTPFGTGPNFIIRDRDAKFGADFDRVAKSSGIRVLKTAIRAPLMDASSAVCAASASTTSSSSVNVTCEPSCSSTSPTSMRAGLIRGSRNACRLRPCRSAPVPTDESSRFLFSEGFITTTAEPLDAG